MRVRRNALRCGIHAAAFFLLLLAFQSAVSSNEFASAGYSAGAAAYLNRPLHAKSAALGRAVTAWTNGLAGVQYNPAILDFADGICVNSSYTLFPSQEQRHIGGISGVVPAGDFVVLAPSFRYLTVLGIENRGEDGALYGTFENREYAGELAAAGKTLFDISAGIRIRYLGQAYTLGGNGKATGTGFDVGTVWQSSGPVRVGFSGLNILSYLKWDTQHRDEVLPQARFGVTGAFLDESMIIGMDVAKTSQQPADLALGLEYTLWKTLGLRFGTGTSIDPGEKSIRNPDISLGLGIKHSFIECDYAVILPTENVREMFTNQFTLVLRFQSSK